MPCVSTSHLAMAWSNDGALAAGSGCTCEANLAGCVLRLALQVNLRRILHDTLDIHLDKLVKGVQLLSYQT